MRTLRKSMIALGALAVTASAAAGAGSLSSSPAQASGVSSPASPWSGTTAVAAVPDSVSSRFAVFRERPATPMPAGLAQRLASPDRYGRNAALARSIPTPYGTGWVIPGDGYLCLAVPDPVDGYGETCVTVQLALLRGLWLRLQGDGADAAALDTIVAPDGTARVDVAGISVAPPADGVVSRLGVSADAPPTLDLAG